MWDKIAHFGVSFTIMTILKSFLPLLLAIWITLSIGIGKEFYDNKFDWKDMTVNVLGIIIALLI